MYERKIRRIPIVDKNNNLVGIVTEKDIFNALLKNKDLLNSIVDGNSSMDQKFILKRFSNFWLNNTFFK